MAFSGAFERQHSKCVLRECNKKGFLPHPKAADDFMAERLLVKEASKGALLEALRFLSRRDYFREELRRRLHRKAFRADDIEEALQRCTQLGYLDDSTLTERFAEGRARNRGWSPKRIQMELRRRGVGEEAARRAAVLSPELRREALEVSLRKAEARASKGWWRGREGRNRLLSSLLRRGFEVGEARELVNSLIAERDMQDHEKTE